MTQIQEDNCVIIRCRFCTNSGELGTCGTCGLDGVCPDCFTSSECCVRRRRVAPVCSICNEALD